MDKKKKWYQETPGIIILLILFFPVGIYLMWKHATWKKVTKWIVTGIFALFIVIGATTDDTSKTSDTKATEKAETTEQTKTTEKAETKATEKAETKATEKATPAPTKEIEKEYTLISGNYTSGIDIPVGKCDVTLVSGMGNISSSNMYNGGMNEIFGNEYTKDFKNLELPNETELSISSNVVIKLTYSNIEDGFSGRKNGKEVTLSSGNHTAGTDFEEGVYNITLVEGSGNVSSSNIYDGGINEIFGTDSSYIKESKNISLPSGTTLEISGGLTLKLTKQE